MLFSFESLLVVTSLTITGAYCLGMIWFISGIRRSKSVVCDRFKVSIVVAARDEENRIGGLLNDLSSQKHAFIEVIVVDDHSEDNTCQVVKNWCEKDTKYKLISLSGSQGKKAALSEGVSKSKGDIILTTDADCRVGHDWVSTMVQYFTPEVGFVIGFSQLEVHQYNLRSSYETIDFLGLMACIWGSWGHDYPMAASGQNLAFRKCVYEEVGGYSDIMHRVSGDDVLLMQKVRALNKWKVGFADNPKGYAFHPCASSWLSLVNQRTRWASNAPQMFRMAPFFFIYLSIVYFMNLFVLVLPILFFAGNFILWPLLVMVFSKSIVDWTIFSRISDIASRSELKKFWPLWFLLQPLFVVLVGFMGPLGLFRWKRRTQRFGREM